MSQSAIRRALTEHIAAIGLTPPIMWPNQANWTTPQNQTWLRVTYLFGEKFQLNLSDADELVGIVAIDIFKPKSSGTLDAYAISDQLDAAFSRLTPISSNGVTIYISSVTPAEPRDDDPWWMMTFSANFRCFMDKL